MKKTVTKYLVHAPSKGGSSVQFQLVVTMSEWESSVADFLTFKEKQKTPISWNFSQFLSIEKYKTLI